MSTFSIVQGKDSLSANLLMHSSISLQEASRQLNMAISFSGMLDGQNIAACLIEKRTGCFEIVNWVVAENYRERGYGKEILLYTLDFAYAHGERFVEIGAGNDNLLMFSVLQKIGFRVIGVIPDAFLNPHNLLAPAGGIINRDMIRYRFDFQDVSSPSSL